MSKQIQHWRTTRVLKNTTHEQADSNGHATWLLENRLMLYHDNSTGWEVQVHIQVPSTFDQTNSFTSSRQQTPLCWKHCCNAKYIPTHQRSHTYSKQEAFKCQGKLWPERKSSQARTQSLCGQLLVTSTTNEGKHISSTAQAKSRCCFFFFCLTYYIDHKQNTIM